MEPSNWQLVLYLFAALLALFLLMRPRIEGSSYGFSREAEAVHVVMNLGMAAMVSTLWSTQTALATQVLLIATAIILGLNLLWRRGDVQRVASTLYHFGGVAAMIYAIHIMPPVEDMANMAGHMHHHESSWISMALGSLFLLDGIATLVVVVAFPTIVVNMGLVGSEGSAVQKGSLVSTKGLRISAIPHVIMDFGMALMLF